MLKINEDVFNSVADSASLQDKSKLSDEIQRYVMVYDVPKNWINQLKKNKFKSSQYFKQAVFEKMKRDGIL